MEDKEKENAFLYWHRLCMIGKAFFDARFLIYFAKIAQYFLTERYDRIKRDLYNRIRQLFGRAA